MLTGVSEARRKTLLGIGAGAGLRIPPWARRAGIAEDALCNGAIGLHGRPRRGPAMAMAPIYVRGAVQAGAWKEAMEWPRDDWFPIAVPPGGRVRRLPRFGLTVRGPSMNAVYPDRATLICVRFSDLGRAPRSGDRVICQRVNRNGMIEATVKELVIANGVAWLWPRSDHPAHQTPIRLPGPRDGGAWRDHPTADAHDLGDSEQVDLIALVIGSYIAE